MAQRFNIEDEIDEDSHPLQSLAEALEDVQGLSGDDSVKWNAIRAIVTAMYRLNPEADILLTYDTVYLENFDTEVEYLDKVEVAD